MDSLLKGTNLDYIGHRSCVRKGKVVAAKVETLGEYGRYGSEEGLGGQARAEFSIKGDNKWAMK